MNKIEIKFHFVVQIFAVLFCRTRTSKIYFGRDVHFILFVYDSIFRLEEKDKNLPNVRNLKIL